MFSQYRRRLLGTTLLIGAALAAQPAFAQNTPSDNAAPSDTQTPAAGTQSQDSAGPAEATSSGDIVVTGTLIKNPNLIASAPVAVVGQEEIQLRQSNVAEEILRDIPGTVPSVGSAVNNGNGGSSFVNLRGLGVNRNIVLLDGVRLVPAGLTGVFDLNNIPLALVDRVDVLTGGASTTYGADAVSGVVNFITRSDFQGAEMSASEQITQRGDGNFFRTDITLGANFDDGKGNAVFSIGYQQSDPVYQGDRNFSLNQINSQTGSPSGSGTTVPARFTGTRPIDPVTGQPSVNPVTANGGVRQLNPATGQAITTFATFNFNPFNIFQTPFTRYNMYGAGHYEVTDGIEVYTRGIFSKNSVKTIVAPSGSFSTVVTIPLSNPYLPAALRNQFCAFNIAPVDPVTGKQLTYVPRFTPAQCAAAALATNPADPNYRTVDTQLGRRAVEVGPRISDFTTQFFDYRAGVRGGITDSINFDLFGAYGQSERRQAIQGYVLTSRLRQALLATNTTTCITNTGGCVPVNVFGAAGTILPNQIPFLTGEATVLTQTSLAQARGVINGDFGFGSPFAEEPINFAVGAEYRKYTAQIRSDSRAQTAGELGGFGAAAPNVTGAYDVYEGFGEIVAPLVSDRPFFHSLTAEAGIRRSHYRIDAPGRPSFTTTTYKFGGSWEPAPSLKLRGNYQRAVRAPNIGELFAPVVTGLTNLSTDPCASLDNKGNRVRPAPTPGSNLYNICIAQGATPANIVSIGPPTAGQANITAGGNVNLKPEKSNSYTIGAVFQPDFLRNFTVSVDYYNIKVTGAVSAPTPGDIIASCFGSNVFSPPANAGLPACTSTRRNPVTGQLDGNPADTPGLFAVISNLGRLKTDGIDLTANYRTDLDFAKLNLSFNGNYTRSSKFQATPTALNRDCVNFYSPNCASIQPKFSFNQRTTLSFGDVDLSLLWRYIDAVRQEPDDVINGNGPVVPKFARIKAHNYFDLSARFGVSTNFDMTVTIQNLLDKQPPVVGSTVGATAFNSGNTYPSTYDALGRRFAVGARLKF